MRVEPKSDGDGAHWRLCGGYKIVYQLIAPKGSLERVCRQNLTALSEPIKIIIVEVDRVTGDPISVFGYIYVSGVSVSG